jgi:hypothetical protein
MKIYASRLWWYLAIVLIVIGMLYLPNEFTFGAVLAAMVIYVPISLFWAPVSYLMYKHYKFQPRVLGLELKTLSSCILLVGVG